MGRFDGSLSDKQIDQHYEGGGEDYKHMTRWREIALLCRSCPLSSAWILHAYIPLHYSVGYNE